MTKPDAVKYAYHWAWNVWNDKKSCVMWMLCAKQVLEAVELYGVSDACYEVLTNLPKEWRSSKRDGFIMPIKELEGRLGIREEVFAS